MDTNLHWASCVAVHNRTRAHSHVTWIVNTEFNWFMNIFVLKMVHDQNKEYDEKPQGIAFPELMLLFCSNVLAVGNAISAIRCNCIFYFILFY